MSTNKAAERLRQWPEATTGSVKEFRAMLDAALAAERRATLERLEARWMNLTDRVFDAAGLRRGMHAIFDEEAAR